MTRKDEQIRTVIEAARSQIGYRALPNRRTPFGDFTGYPEQVWAGSFLTYAMSTALIPCPPLTATSSALAEFVRTNRLYRTPRTGDVVFFVFPTEGSFGQPHVGLVTEVAAGNFRCVEGQTASGNPRGNQDASGVFERTRYLTDVLGFGRPGYGKRTRKAAPPTETVRTLAVQPGKTNQQVEAVQRRLGNAVQLQEAKRGTFDSATRSAYARWQRVCGKAGPDADGTPDSDTLIRLGFEVK